MVSAENQLKLQRCPHCKVDTPLLRLQWKHQPKDSEGRNAGYWAIYFCDRCGGGIMIKANGPGNEVINYYPQTIYVDENVPSKARKFLEQALDSLHAPAGAIMLANSSIDAMLKEIGYREGNLYPRIEQAAADHKITEEMKLWAHQIRLDANDQRHADADAELPTKEKAELVNEFAIALAQFLFVLPARVTRGIAATGPAPPSSDQS